MVRQTRFRRGLNRSNRSKGSHRHSHSSLTLHSLRGYPDVIKVTLPYSFNYPVTFKTQPVVSNFQTGDLLMLFSGNGYPNIGGPNITSLAAAGRVTRLEMPQNFMSFASRYGKAVCHGSHISASASFGGTFNQTWSNPIDGLMFNPAMVTFSKVPYDNSHEFDGETPGTFYYNGTLSGLQRPTNPLTATGNLLSLINLPMEETMSTPNTRYKCLSNVFGSKTMAKFKDGDSCKRFLGIHDPEDAEDLNMTTPQNYTDNPIDVGTDMNPLRGFAYVMKGFVFNPTAPTSGDSGTTWLINGRIDYHYSFSSLRPTPQSDWIFGAEQDYPLGDDGNTGTFDPGNGYTGIAWG